PAAWRRRVRARVVRADRHDQRPFAAPPCTRREHDRAHRLQRSGHRAGHGRRPRVRPPYRRRGDARRDVPAGNAGKKCVLPHGSGGLLRGRRADRAFAADAVIGRSYMERFKGKTAVVTGGAQGIGLATAERLHAEGANVFIADIQGWDEAEASQSLVRGDRVAYRRTDVSRAAEVEAMMAEAEARFGAIDILVSNVGIARSTPFLDIKEEELATGIQTN